MKSGKIYFLPWMSDILYAVYSFCFIMFLVMNFDPSQDWHYRDQKFLSESRCFCVNEYGRLLLFCDD